jgi:hypothetical protein
MAQTFCGRWSSPPGYHGEWESGSRDSETAKDAKGTKGSVGVWEWGVGSGEKITYAQPRFIFASCYFVFTSSYFLFASIYFVFASDYFVFASNLLYK